MRAGGTSCHRHWCWDGRRLPVGCRAHEGELIKTTFGTIFNLRQNCVILVCWHCPKPMYEHKLNFRWWLRQQAEQLWLLLFHRRFQNQHQLQQFQQCGHHNSDIQVREMPGAKIGLILCGGNVDTEKLPWHIVKPASFNKWFLQYILHDVINFQNQAKYKLSRKSIIEKGSIDRQKENSEQSIICFVCIHPSCFLSMHQSRTLRGGLSCFRGDPRAQCHLLL